MYKSSEVSVKSISSSSSETYLPILSEVDLRRYRTKGYKGIYLGMICIGLQPLFLESQNVTCFLALLDIRRRKLKKALISAIKFGLNNGLVIEVQFHFRS